MNTKVYVVRHAEVDNPEDIEYMRLPGFGLSNHGREQAHFLAEYLADKKISYIYSSPLLRTKETAKIIANKKLRVHYIDKLTEANYKKWQGIRRKDRPKDEVDGYYNHPVKYSAILGESLSDIQKRVTEAIFDIVEKHQGQNVLVVTHASPLILSMLHFQKRPLSDFSKIQVDYACMTIISLDSQLQCTGVTYNSFRDLSRNQNER